GQERLVSERVDHQMTVDATRNNVEKGNQTGKFVKGVLAITRKFVATQNYIADNKSDDDKALIVEHPIRTDWKLVGTDKPIETTDTLYRFKGIVTPDKTSTLTVKEESVQDEELAILPTHIDAVLMYSRTGQF